MLNQTWCEYTITSLVLAAHHKYPQYFRVATGQPIQTKIQRKLLLKILTIECDGSIGLNSYFLVPTLDLTNYNIQAFHTGQRQILNKIYFSKPHCESITVANSIHIHPLPSLIGNHSHVSFESWCKFWASRAIVHLSGFCHILDWWHNI